MSSRSVPVAKEVLADLRIAQLPRATSHTEGGLPGRWSVEAATTDTDTNTHTRTDSHLHGGRGEEGLDAGEVVAQGRVRALLSDVVHVEVT